MPPPVSDIAFTPTVKALQERFGSRRTYAKMEKRGGWRSVVTQALAEFIADRDTFFIATANADGQPYIQHRGGPRGFLKVLDEHTLGFADFRGNQQFITVGNLQDNPKSIIFLMDFATRHRFKIWGKAKVVEDDPALREKLCDPRSPAAPERMFLFHVEAWDCNCPQHITPRFTEAEIDAAMQALRDRIEDLEAKLRACAPQ